MYLSDKLKKYATSGFLPMHMPGHKRNYSKFPWLTGLGCRTDITEISGFDNLNEPEGIFAELNSLAAETWGAKHSIAMTNGSTGAILAAVKTVMGQGGRIIIFRGCHKSVYNAAELCGADIEYILPETEVQTGIWKSVTPEQVKDSLEKFPDTKLVVITSPTYEGVISDISGISRVCREREVILMVDEAHGAHLGFGGFPESSVKLGADIVVQSLHKTLPSLTQTAMLHLCSDRVDYISLMQNAAIFQSSSPSYILSSSIDGCVRYMAERGNAEAEAWLSCLTICDDAAKKLKRLRIMRYGGDRTENSGFFSFDPSKLVVLTTGAQISGPELGALLRDEYSIEVEMISTDYLIAMTGMGDTPDTIKRFCQALLEIDGNLRTRKNICEKVSAVSVPEKIMTPGEAALCRWVQLPLSESVGEISREYVWAYPPGAPVLVPGERIDNRTVEQIIELYSAGVSVHSTRKDVPYSICCVDKSY